ncbi:TPA: helix-turn-helix domain-containing protein [Salmonella enterica]|nr:helix-turn-helix domain-containing protein [Salmonella enterica]
MIQQDWRYFPVHWPKNEKLITDAPGVMPEQIWPFRYRQSG